MILNMKFCVIDMYCDICFSNACQHCDLMFASEITAFYVNEVHHFQCYSRYCFAYYKFLNFGRSSGILVYTGRPSKGLLTNHLQ